MLIAWIVLVFFIISNASFSLRFRFFFVENALYSILFHYNWDIVLGKIDEIHHNYSQIDHRFDRIFSKYGLSRLSYFILCLQSQYL